MSNMRDLEAQLRAAKGDTSDIELEVPFWEFLDIDFDGSTKTFYLNAYYVQKSNFPQLYQRMSDSPPLKRIRDEIAGKAEKPRIHKQNWRPRSDFEIEIGASNIIYMLVDTKKELFYVGEADSLIARFRRGHELISEWDYYRYDALPAALTPYRVQIERMLIRDIDSLLGVSASGLPVSLSAFKLVNLKIDR